MMKLSIYYTEKILRIEIENNMINLNTGLIKINSELEIHPEYIFEDFKKSSYYNGQDEIRMIDIDGKQEIVGKKYLVSLFFEGSKIYSILLLNCDKKLTPAFV